MEVVDKYEKKTALFFKRSFLMTFKEL